LYSQLHANKNEIIENKKDMINLLGKENGKRDVGRTKNII
jgi:hypothetical protein